MNTKGKTTTIPHKILILFKLISKSYKLVYNLYNIILYIYIYIYI